MFLLAQDTVNGAEGKITMTRNGKISEIAGMRNIQTDADIQTTDMRCIGSRTIQKKPNGAALTGKGNVYFGSNGSNAFADMVLRYINEGILDEFDIVITNSDPATSMGNQIVGYYGCHLTGSIPLSILNDEESMLNYDFNFAYNRVARLKAFKDPTNLGN